MAERYATFDINPADGTIRVSTEAPDQSARSDMAIRYGEDFLGITYTEMLLVRQGSIAYEDEGQPRARIVTPDAEEASA